MAPKALTPLPVEEAISKGLKRYYTGLPCKRGHLSERSVSKRMCLACKNEQTNASYHANPYGKRARSRELYRLNIEAKKAVYRANYKENKEKWRTRARRFRDKDPERFKLINRIKTARYRARKRASKEHFTRDDVALILRLQKRKCAYCRMKLLGSDYHVDHIRAVSKGGDNSRRNIQIACGDCNRRKAARDSLDFARSLGMLL